jgi:hypothetical protein
VTHIAPHPEGVNTPPHFPIIDVSYDDLGHHVAWSLADACCCAEPWRHAHGVTR